MKILTWNLERPRKANQAVLDELAKYNADIVVLTETNAVINLGEAYTGYATTPLVKGHDGIDYKEGENRTTIWTKYPVKAQYPTYDPYTAVSIQIESPMGLIVVYGTIIGVFGGLGERFKSDFESQLLDMERLSHNTAFCLIGDLNCTFSGRAYPSHEVRNKLNATFEQLNLTNTTAQIENNIDHIVLSTSYLENKKCTIETWNHDKMLSDHIGVCLTIGR